MERSVSGTVADEVEHFAGIGVAAQRLLREHQVAVYGDFEHATGGLDELDLGVGVGFLHLGRQPGGPWFVVSNDAVLDRNLHVPARGLRKKFGVLES
jgi:hypothetical protein